MEFLMTQFFAAHDNDVSFKFTVESFYVLFCPVFFVKSATRQYSRTPAKIRSERFAMTTPRSTSNVVSGSLFLQYAENRCQSIFKGNKFATKPHFVQILTWRMFLLSSNPFAAAQPFLFAKPNLYSHVDPRQTSHIAYLFTWSGCQSKAHAVPVCGAHIQKNKYTEHNNVQNNFIEKVRIKIAWCHIRNFQQLPQSNISHG